MRWRFYLLEFSIYIPMAFFIFIGSYFNQLHFSDFQNGLLGSISAVILLFSNPFWMNIADKRVKNKVLIFLSFASTVLIWGIFIFKTFWLVLFASLAVGFLWTSIVPVAESISAKYSEELGFSFGKARMMGSIGFSAIMLMIGYVKNDFYFFTIGSLSFIIIGIISFFIPQTKGYNVGKKLHFSFRGFPLAFYKMLILDILVLSSNMFGLYFLPILMKSRGYPVSFAGIAISLQALIEIPFLFFADRILNFLGIKRTLVIASFLFGIRWILTWALSNPLAVISIQLLEFFNWIAVYYVILQYVNLKISPSRRSDAHAIFWMTTSGFSVIFGSIFGGWLANTFGVSNAYLFFGILALSASIVYWFTEKPLSD
ncbi:MFS transporter [Mesoaciditoga lauensis]|uniref:MFS transporter n=1 Tax=Mesoaciditoga lauensis TaxID=1495039 RepID=UPI000564CD0E|nr:MFS transporter [Mesoaciditoga lauensis]